MTRMASLLLGALGTLAGIADTAAAADPGQRIDRHVAAVMQRDRIPGLAVGVIRNGVVIRARGYGLANVERNIPVSADTLFQLASLSKHLTAVGIMLLVERGELRLSDRLTRFFPQGPAAWRRISVRQLLNHTSGIPDYDDRDIDLQRDYTDDELVRIAARLPLEFEPGQRWQYSNTGYLLLGIIIERVSGEFYGDLLARQVFLPAGMRTAQVNDINKAVPHRAEGYEWTDDGLQPQSWVSPSLSRTADGSLLMSINDLVAWEASLRAGAILTPQSWAEIYAPAILNDGRHHPYGFGWQLDERAGQPVYGHDGAWQGFRSAMTHYEQGALTVIVLANADTAEAADLLDEIAVLVDPALAARP